MKPYGVFVTGTDTDIGKTVVSAILVKALGAAYFKPIQTGCHIDDDTKTVARLAALGENNTFAPCYSLIEPLSPQASAACEGTSVDPDKLVLPQTDKPLVVEGAGGVFVPVNDGVLYIDVIKRIGLPVILVARSDLGTINHTLLSLEALRSRGIHVAGVIMSGDPNPRNRQAIEEFGKVRVLFEVPKIEGLSPETLDAFAKSLTLDPHSILGQAPDEGSDDIVELDKKHIWHPFLQAKTAPDPINIVRANGATLYTDKGTSIVDCISSWWVTTHGHAHPDVAAAIAAQAASLEQVIFADFTHPPAARLAKAITNLLPGGLDRLFFSDNGSTAVEIALKMAHQYWRNCGEKRRVRFAAFQGGYHGDTVGAMSVGLSCGFYRGFEDLTFSVDFLPYPATWDNDDAAITKEDQAIEAIYAYMGKYKGEVAGIIIEPLIQGASGMRMCRPEFLRRLEKAAKDCETLVIYDEVMTGFGRTGDLFACKIAGTNPDLVCLSKGISAGFLPLAVTVCHSPLYEAFLGDTFDRAFAHGHSFTANPIGCAAGLASLRVMEKEKTLNKIAAIQNIHRTRLNAIQSHPLVEKTRTRGDIAAFDMKVPDSTTTARFIASLQEFCLNEGYFIRPLDNVMYLMPPYCISHEDLHGAWDCIERALNRM